MMDNVQNILPVIAALANDESREMYAKVIVQDVPKTPNYRDRKLLARLEAVRLIEKSEDGLWQATEVFSDYLSRLKSAKNQVTDDVERFLVKGRVHTWPSRAQDKNALLRWILQKSIPASEQCSEREMNERIRRYTDDPALVRRYGVDHEYLNGTPQLRSTGASNKSPA